MTKETRNKLNNMTTEQRDKMLADNLWSAIDEIYAEMKPLQSRVEDILNHTYADTRTKEQQADLEKLTMAINAYSKSIDIINKQLALLIWG